MRTLQEKYNAVLEGNFSKEQFKRDAVMQLPNLVSKFNSFEDVSTILKNRGMIAEAKMQQPVYSTAKPEDTIAPDVLDTGIKFELDKKYGTLDVTDEQYAKCKEMAIKNLSKDILYYVKQDSIQLETPGEEMEKVKLHEETALDRAEDHASSKVQDKLGDIADTVAEKPASVAAAFKKMVLDNPTHYAKMSAHELEQEFNKFKLEEANKVEDGIELTDAEMETLRKEKKITLPNGSVLHYVGKVAESETPKYSEEELAQMAKDQQEHDEETLRRERGLEERQLKEAVKALIKKTLEA